MLFSRASVAFMGLASMVSAISPSVDKRAIVVPIVQQITENNIIVVQQNLDVIEELVQIAEQQFAARLQAQFALVSQLETIKNNIRINHFGNMFGTVNTIIVTVTNVLDVRSPNDINNRYFINQLVANNGAPESQIVVMVTASETMTIGAQETDSSEIDQLIEQIAIGQVGLPRLRNHDVAFPFGQLNESILLPFGTQAPTNSLVFSDPANIIFAGQTGLFIENSQTFARDCSLFTTLSNSFLSPLISIFPTFQQLAAAQARNLILGSGIPLSFLFQTSSLSFSSEEATTTTTEETTTTTTEEETTTTTTEEETTTTTTEEETTTTTTEEETTTTTTEEETTTMTTEEETTTMTTEEETTTMTTEEETTTMMTEETTASETME